MKKVSVFFASAACLVAAAGVYAKAAKAALATVWYIPSYAHATGSTPTTPFCTVPLSTSSCDGSSVRCTLANVSYDTDGTVALVYVSKKLTTNGDCVAAFKH
jgi:hypothetical protein